MNILRASNTVASLTWDDQVCETRMGRDGLRVRRSPPSRVCVRTHSLHCRCTRTVPHQSPSRSHILLTLTPSASIRLLFSGTTQRLLTCELTSPSLEHVLWEGQPLILRSSWDTLDNNDDADSPPANPQKLLNSRFGPTYPPNPHPAFPDERVLLYDGVAFGYPDKPRTDRHKQAYPLNRVLVNERSAKAGPLEFPDLCRDVSDDSPVADITVRWSIVRGRALCLPRTWSDMLQS